MASTRESGNQGVGRHRVRNQPAMDTSDAVDASSSALAREIAQALAEEIEEVDSYDRRFTGTLTRMFVRVLRMARSSPEIVLFFHEAIPGYTLTLVKRDLGELPKPGHRSPRRGSKTVRMKKEQESDLPGDLQAAHILIRSYAERTGKSVILVEYNDAILLFFPAENFRRSVEELGYLDLLDDADL